MTRSRGLVFLVAALALATPLAHAQDYPTRSITLVVPYAAGGGNDAMARIVADHMGKTLGQQIVIENRGGAGGTIATRAVAKAAQRRKVRVAAEGFYISISFLHCPAQHGDSFRRIGCTRSACFASSGFPRPSSQRWRRAKTFTPRSSRSAFPVS